MWKQGYDKIPEDDPPLLFNEIVKRKKGILGANTLYQIICYEHPELETYYCGMYVSIKLSFETTYKSDNSFKYFHL